MFTTAFSVGDLATTAVHSQDEGAEPTAIDQSDSAATAVRLKFRGQWSGTNAAAVVKKVSVTAVLGQQGGGPARIEAIADVD